MCLSQKTTNRGNWTMPSVKVRIGEPIDKALRALKKKLDKEGIMKAAKAHRFYDKPSVKSRLKSKAATKRTKTAIRRGY
jgi:small subunit ribosomal protein S21